MLALANKLTTSTQPIYRFVNKYSIDFDGVDDCIVTDGADTVAQPTTYSFWCKTSETGRNSVFGHGQDNYGSFSLNETNMPLLWLNNTNYRYWTNISAQDDGEWHHWVVYADTNDITNSKLYVDGVLQTSGSTSNTTTTSPYITSLIIGGTREAGGYFFQGKIDEFAVYDRELTQDEITRMYNSGTPINLNLNASAYQSANPLITSTKSMEFDGSDNFLKVEDSANLRGMAALTVCCWVKFDSKSDYAKVLDYSSTSGNSQRKYRIQTNNATDQKIQFLIANTSDSTSTITSTDAMPTGRWVHLVGTFDNSLSSNRQSFYIDGVLDNTATAFTETINNDDSGFLSFGENTYGSNNFDGKITEAGAYNRALTSLEVASLYNQGVPTDLLVSRGDYVATGLQGYWKMGDGTNDEYPVIYDQTNPTLGSELVTNGDFSNGTTDWTPNASATLSIDTGRLKIAISGAASGYAHQTFAIESGKQYKCTGTVDFGTASQMRFYVSNTGQFFDITQSGNFNFTFTSTGTSTQIRLYTYGDGNYGFWDNVSVKEVQGNPATMTNMVEGNITNQFPLTKIRNYYRMGDGILDGYPIIQDQTSPNLAHIPTTNVVLNSNVFINQSATLTPNYGISPDGTQNSTRVQASGSNSGVRINTINSSNNAFAYSVYVKGVSGETVNVRVETSPYSLLIQYNFTLNGEWQRIENVLTALTTHTQRNFYVTKLGSSTATDFQLYGSQIEEQSQATAYIKSDGIAAVRKATTTNLVNYSEDFSQSYWSKINGVTVTSSTIISPDGVSLAQGLQFDGTDNGRIEVNVGSYSNLTQSVYLKVASGTASVQIGFTGGSQLTVTVTNEWQRFEYFQASGTFPRVRCNDNKLIYVWGLQVEEQTQAETYAKTTGLPVEIDLFTQNSYGTMTNMSASDIIEDTPNN